MGPARGRVVVEVIVSRLALAAGQRTGVRLFDLLTTGDLSVVIVAVDAHRRIEQVPGRTVVPRDFADGVVAKLNVTGLIAKLAPAGDVQCRDDAAVHGAVRVEMQNRVQDVPSTLLGAAHLMASPPAPAPNSDTFVLRVRPVTRGGRDQRGKVGVVGCVVGD